MITVRTVEIEDFILDGLYFWTGQLLSPVQKVLVIGIVSSKSWILMIIPMTQHTVRPKVVDLSSLSIEGSKIWNTWSWTILCKVCGDYQDPSRLMTSFVNFTREYVHCSLCKRLKFPVPVVPFLPQASILFYQYSCICSGPKNAWNIWHWMLSNQQ